MQGHIELNTDRLILRRPRLRDASRIATLLNNYQVTKNLARVPYPYTLNMALDWLWHQGKHWQPEAITFAICDKNNVLMGFCGTHSQGDVAEIGYWLGEPYWGQGIMTEACTAVIKWYFENCTADRLVSGVFTFNPASLAIQKNLGFIQTGLGKRICLAQNANLDHIETELTRARFMSAMETK